VGQMDRNGPGGLSIPAAARSTVARKRCVARRLEWQGCCRPHTLGQAGLRGGGSSSTTSPWPGTAAVGQNLAGPVQACAC